MKLLDAINLCLRSSGHGSVNEVTDSDENTALCKGVITRVRKEILEEGYSFNRDKVTLQVDSSGKVPISKDYLKVELPLDISFRKSTDGNLYLWDLGENEWRDEALEDVHVVFDIKNDASEGDDFDLLPEAFAQWIARKAAAEFFFENNQAASGPLEGRATRAQTHAINSLPPTSIHEATGYSMLAAYAAGGTGAIHTTGRVWINVG